MSQASTGSKHNYIDSNNHQPVQLAPTSVAHSSLTMAKLSRNQEYPSLGDNKDKTSSFAGRCEVNETYSDHDDEANLDARLDFSQCKVPGREEHIDSLHKIHNFVSRGSGRQMDKRQGETSVAIIGGSSGTGKSTLIKQFQNELRKKSQLPEGHCMPFFIEGKFDKLVGADPFSAIVEAFTNFAEDMTQQDTEELNCIRSRIKLYGRVQKCHKVSWDSTAISLHDERPMGGVLRHHPWSIPSNGRSRAVSGTF